MKYEKQYKDKPSIATKCTCNWGGIEVLDIENGERVVSCENYGNGRISYAKSRISYNLNGDAYFMRRGRREYLNEYMTI